jgi:hypothetical protein
MRAFISVLSFVAVIALNSASSGDTIVPGGDVHGTWSAAGSPYLIQGDIAVPADSVLVIEPGADAVFQPDCALTVSGALTAVGTAQDSITFTAPERAEWGGILIEETAGPVQLSFCIIERGAATGTGVDRNGGGMYSFSSDVTIANSVFRENRAVGWGGALCLQASIDAPAVISDCLFSGNHADLQGGGLYYIGPDLQLTRCRFVDNITEVKGGGVCCVAWLFGSVLVDDCHFEGNSASEDGGGLMVKDLAQNGITVSNCEFVSNDGGPAVHVDHGVSVIRACTFDRNFASGTGALYCDGTDAEIESCTFSSNWAYEPGMALYLTNGTVSVANTVVSGTGDACPDEGMYLGSGSFSVEYCDLFRRSDGGEFTGPGVPTGLGVLVGVNAVGDPCDVYSNILLDPLFCDRQDGDLRIAEDSPCLGAGESGADIGAHGIGCETLVRPTTN